jgi:protoheme IX farnesyltransferase
VHGPGYKFSFMRVYLDLTKSGIVFYVLVTGLAGFALSQPVYDPIDSTRLVLTMFSLYFFSSGSFAINQAQEWSIDEKMPRTLNRPIPSGKVSISQAYILGVGFLLLGLFFAVFVNEMVVWLGIATVVMYNGLYTLYWKKKWAFGAVPGAIPGAMSVVIGYAANSPRILEPACVYGFIIMFLWQMPHFWSLAIRYKDDYAAGGIPVLPTRIGTQATLYHMGLYTFAYVMVAMASPWIVVAHYAYIFLVIPSAMIVLWQFFKYYRAGAQRQWLAFFLWINASMLVFLVAPVIDRWLKSYGF